MLTVVIDVEGESNTRANTETVTRTDDHVF